jgi:23S rRNA (cytidine1920-2'-O)/16S rRNA (cytidine1409-2'-O)-methyltransferase
VRFVCEGGHRGEIENAPFPSLAPTRRRYGSRVSRRRADTLLAERGLAPSRTAAARSVRAGHVRLPGGRRVAKPSELLPIDAALILEGGREFVSRGGIKLENAIGALPIEIAGRRCLDVGASTGGFTDCLLRGGAESVIALDVGYGQLDWGLRQDSRVSVLERVNGRDLQPELLPYVPDLVTVDVSFISIVKLLEAVVRCAAEEMDLIGLVKPQFELGAKRVGRGGVVRDPEDRRDAVRGVAKAAAAHGLSVRGFASSGLPGPKGNLETFIWCDRSGDDSLDLEAAISEIE